MPKTIVQKILFKKTSPKTLYELYMDSKKHTAATGAQAKISAKEGGKYSAYDGYATGTNLKLVRDKLIVQTWRASNWEDKEGDSTFILHLEPKGKDTVAHMIHANVPDNEEESLSKGWFEYYWNPWKSYLKG